MSLSVSRLPSSFVAANTHVKPSVLIIGGGPAGLMRAILSLKNGNSTRIIERRAEFQAGRENTVAIKDEAFELLKEHGIYDYLVRENLVFPPSQELGLMVRLCDLEKAMKAVIATLTNDSVLSYSSEVAEIVPRKDATARVMVKSKGGAEAIFPDVLVVADGSHSSTEKLLGISRTQVLPTVPVVAASFKDNRPKIVSVSTFFKYVGITILNTFTKVYYFSLFIFKMIFQGENLFNVNRKIRGALILPTPGQNYLGYCLNAKESEKLEAFEQRIVNCQEKLKKAKDQAEIARAKKELAAAIKRRDKNLEYWAQLSFIFANVHAFGVYLYQWLHCKKDREWMVVKWLPYDGTHTKMIKIGADKADKSCGMVGRTAYLVGGDALASVDPATARGCRTALESSEWFFKVIQRWENKEPPANLLVDYRVQAAIKVEEIHQESREFRRLYRPDAV